MKIPDANVLLYARNRDDPHHERARQWCERALSIERVGFATTVLLAFIRIASGRFAFQSPLTAEEAFDDIDWWLAQPTSRVINPGPRHFVICRELMDHARGAGDIVMDAHLAALAIESSATLTSFDADFHRFPGLDFEFLR